jgi:RNA polymerase sigma-70 factor, ECF subfamily
MLESHAEPQTSLTNQMISSSQQNVTELLNEWQQGDPEALDKLTPIVYDELRRMAHRYVRHEQNGNTLQTTELVNEAYMRLLGNKNYDWQSRSHFFGVIAQVMRHILIDHARRRHFAKHGGGVRQVSLEHAALMTQQRAAELVALDDALAELSQFDSRKSRVVELRYFGGLSLEEAAQVLEVSLMTVRRDWRAAKAWLYRRLNSE